jgi:Tol biopolymer transport system component
MALSAGRRLGPYEIQAAIGAGGMGEVYRARDTKLNRDVALKVLPDSFATDVERLARFKREAQLLASLNHPNIGAIYGLEDSAPSTSSGQAGVALVLELVEGPTLADRIAQGPLPLDEALPVAKQIAEALEAAHEQGIIHRDLKPANIKVTAAGKVKVLDFGLAKLVQPEATASSLTMSPTLSVQATYAGVILGTAAYMSPEQTRGKPLDRRTDIWAFGCVLFEMLTGHRPFDVSETVSDAVASILKNEPDWTRLPADTPHAVRTLLRRCLQKDLQKRLPHIGSARLEIEEALLAPSEQPVTRSAAQAPAPSRLWPWTAAIVASSLAAALFALWAPWRTAPVPPAVRVHADIGADASLVTDVGTAAVLSPNGQLLAFAAQKGPSDSSQLYVRRLDQLHATALSGTDDARAPFFSPDGQWIAFFARGKLKKVAVSGGGVVTLCDAPAGRGGSWGDDGTIVFQPDIAAANSSLARVSSGGGRPEFFPPEQNGRPRFPQILPGSKAMIYTHYGPGRSAELHVQPLPAGERRVLLNGAYGRYLSSGHIVYLQDATLFAVAFDLERLALIGQPAPVLEGVAASAALAPSAAQFAVSDHGTLVYVPGQSTTIERLISWMDRAGKSSPLLAKSTNWSHPRFSPDGRRLAIDIVNDTSNPSGSVRSSSIWIYEWTRDNLSRVTFGAGDAHNPVWTPDGERVVFSSRDNNAAAADDSSPSNLYWQRADGAGDGQRLTQSAQNQIPGSWHPSGKFLAFSENIVQANPNIWVLPVEGNETAGWKPGKPTVFLSTTAIEEEPMFSPDGRWLAYQSNESGTYEVYVRPFPGPGGKWLISSGGGQYPTWSRTRPELFFSNNTQQIMVAPYRVQGDSFQPERPRLWSESRYLARRNRSFDLHPDGDRFALAAAPADPEVIRRDKLVFVFNFFDELRRIAPTLKR